jgi:hypothetical protein
LTVQSGLPVEFGESTGFALSQLVLVLRRKFVRLFPGALAHQFLELKNGCLQRDAVNNWRLTTEKVKINPTVLSMHVIMGGEFAAQHRRRSQYPVSHRHVFTLFRAPRAQIKWRVCCMSNCHQATSML